MIAFLHNSLIFALSAVQRWTEGIRRLTPFRQPLSRLPRTQTVPRPRRASLMVGLGLLLVSGLLGSGLSHATAATVGTIDPVPTNLQTGQRIYLERCATCHVAVPPGLLPRQTWVRLLQTSDHYTTQIQPLTEPDLSLVWGYLRAFSRAYPEGERLEFRLRNSRFFRALHPRVEVPQPVTLNTCATCHLNAARYDFRTLAPEWQNAP